MIRRLLCYFDRHDWHQGRTSEERGCSVCHNVQYQIDTAFGLVWERPAEKVEEIRYELLKYTDKEIAGKYRSVELIRDIAQAMLTNEEIAGQLAAENSKLREALSEVLDRFPGPCNIHNTYNFELEAEGPPMCHSHQWHESIHDGTCPIGRARKLLAKERN